MAPLLDRRQLLVAGLAGAGSLGLAACASSSKTIKVTPPTTAGPAPGATGSSPTAGAGAGPFAVLPNTFDFFSGIDQRVAIALATNGGDPIHPGGPVTIQIGPVDGSLGPEEATVEHTDGLANPYLLLRHRFDRPGNYTLRVHYHGQQADLPIQVILPSATPIPLAGKPMISTPSPTTAAPMGTNPVCTRQPPCPFHTTSLDAALSAHRRVALLFATPALCQSRFCGPVLDNLIAVHQPFAAQITFVHCEIYTDLSGQTSTGPVNAYHLEHEPMLLLAGPDGIVRDRIDNAFDRGEATDALTKLASS